MPRFQTVLAALAAVAVLAVGGLIQTTPVAADEPHRVIALKLDDGQPLTVELDGTLEPGETRQLFTEDGREVLLSRDDDGLSLTVDGETIDLPELTTSGHGTHELEIEIDGPADGHHLSERVMIVHDGEAHSAHGQSFVWHSNRGHDAVERLESSGALDGLDEETRQRIVDALTDPGDEKVFVKTIVIERDEETDDDD